MSKPFLIQGPNGEQYELEGTAKGIEVYRTEYMPRHFKIAHPQPQGRERPDLSEKKKVANSKGVQKMDDMTRAQLEELATERGIDDPTSFDNKAALIDAIEGKTEDTADAAPVEHTTDTDADAGDGESGPDVLAQDGDGGSE